MKDKLKEYLDLYLNQEEKISSYNLEYDSAKKTYNAINFNSDFNFEKKINVDNFNSYSKSKKISVDNFINNNKDENNFQKTLFKYIDEKNLKDSDVYNKVHLDRRLFSKIRNDNNYHPSRETVILLGLSLELGEKEMDKLMLSASYSLSKNNYYDLIIRFCFINGIYKIKDVNDLLSEYDCKLFNY